MQPISFLLLLTGFGLTACDAPSKIQDPISAPPVAEQVPTWIGAGDQQRLDEYYWIRDDERSDPKVLALLAAENAYGQQLMAHTERLQTTLFQEITNRLPKKDATVPIALGGYQYYRVFEPGLEHPIYKRFQNDNPDTSEVVLDVNQLAQSFDYFAVGNWVVNPAQDLIAYAEDTLSRRIYTLRIKAVGSDISQPDVITGAAPSMAWSQDGQSLFYIKKHPQTLLEHEVYRHQLGTDQSQDQLVYRETDPTFSLWLEESRSKAFIFIRASSTESTEILIIPRKTPLAAPYPLLARTDQHEYRARHLKDHFYLLTNDEAPNYRLMRVEAKHAGDQSAWEPVITPDPGTFIEDFEVFDTFIVTKEIEAGIARLRIYDQSGQPTRDIPIQDIPATLNLSANPDATSTVIRYELSSLKTPDSTLAFNTETGDTQLLKQAQVDGSFNPDHYTTEYHTFSASDGAEVPISLVYNHTLKRQPRPAYLYAYGSYGYSTEPYFRSSSLSLLDRGFVFAIIHVRGGQELGRQWYEQGRLQHKKNTFTDFIEGSRYLASTGLADPNNLFAAGGSAGGLLMGVIANEAPEVYQGIIAKVPFVDVVTTMLDDSIPLTTSEYREWGDPRIAADYDYMLSYSPYDQVKAQGYPNMLVTTGLHDSQVQYFEPAKWVARLRRLKTDENHLILDTDMASGHSGPSGRYERYRKTALEYAFILDHLKTAP